MIQFPHDCSGAPVEQIVTVNWADLNPLPFPFKSLKSGLSLDLNCLFVIWTIIEVVGIFIFRDEAMTDPVSSSKNDNYKAVYLTAEDLRVAASILYIAYHDDPFYLSALDEGNQTQYEQKLRGVIREELVTLWQEEQTLIGLFDEDRLVGVACVVFQQLPLGEARSWHWRLKMLMSIGWRSTQILIQREAAILEYLPSTHSGILQFIALTKTEQLRGLGARLIQAVISWCDEQPLRDGVGIYITQKTHAHLFANLGFVMLEKLTIAEVEGELLFYPSQETGE